MIALQRHEGTLTMPRVIHFDIGVVDTDRAIAFYKRVFAWKISKASRPLDYWLIQTGANEEPGIDGGIALRTADWQHVTMFVDVESADETANMVVRAGGANSLPLGQM
jgi:predicted enzyme related to lactoylglutathione lyase